VHCSNKKLRFQKIISLENRFMKASRGLLTILCFIILHSCLNAQQWPLKEWPIVTPQSQKISTDSLKTFDDDIVKGKY